MHTRFASFIGLAAVLFVGAAALRQPLPPAVPDNVPATQTPGAAPPCGNAEEAHFSGELFGALAQRVDWRGAALECAGGLRPGGSGARLVFGGRQRDGERLLFVLGIDAVAGEIDGRERPTNVTVVDESTGRFFSSGGQGRCWTDVEASTPGDSGDASRRIRGVLYCAGALPSLNDLSSVTLGDLTFAGRLDADPP
jgi:hypothetical protein